MPPPPHPGTASVVRIPVAGPRPYNTLVVVRETISHGQKWPGDGHVYHSPGTFETSFYLIGFDPRVDVPYEHSTTAVMHFLGLEDDASFLGAFDAVSGTFDGGGRWIVTVDGAVMSDGEDIVVLASVASWILCYEPPPARQPVREQGFGHLRGIALQFGGKARAGKDLHLRPWD